MKTVDVMACTAVERSIRNMEEHYDVGWTESIANAHTANWVGNMRPVAQRKVLSDDELAELKEHIRASPQAGTGEHTFGLNSPLRNLTPGKSAAPYVPVLAKVI